MLPSRLTFSEAVQHTDRFDGKMVQAISLVPGNADKSTIFADDILAYKDRDLILSHLELSNKAELLHFVEPFTLNPDKMLRAVRTDVLRTLERLGCVFPWVPFATVLSDRTTWVRGVTARKTYMLDEDISYDESSEWSYFCTERFSPAYFLESRVSDALIGTLKAQLLQLSISGYAKPDFIHTVQEFFSTGFIATTTESWLLQCLAHPNVPANVIWAEQNVEKFFPEFNFAQWKQVMGFSGQVAA